MILSTSVWAGLLALPCALQANAAEGVYKWVEKDGTVHYSDMPPSKANATKLRTAATAAPPPADAKEKEARPSSTNYVDQDVEFRKRRAAADEAAKKQQEKQQQADQQRQACADSRGRLVTLQQGGRVYRSNEKGERVYFNDKAFAEEIAKEKKFQDQHCKA
jgi:phage pi2 protein 07